MSPAFPGTVVKSRVIGVIEGEQLDGKKKIRNDRIVAVSEATHRYANVKKFSDLPKRWIRDSKSSSSIITIWKGRNLGFGVPGNADSFRLVKKVGQSRPVRARLPMRHVDLRKPQRNFWSRLSHQSRIQARCDASSCTLLILNTRRKRRVMRITYSFKSPVAQPRNISFTSARPILCGARRSARGTGQHLCSTRPK